MTTRPTLAALLVAALPALAVAQPPGPERTVDAAERKAVIDGVLAELNKSYVFPEVAKKMEEAVRARQARNEYDNVTSGREFARLLTEHLREVSKDKHLHVDFFPRGLPKNAGSGRPSGEQMKRMKERAALRNYGFKKVERLDGGVGLLEFEGFPPPEFAGETAAAAMGFLANSSAVIIDLRKNGGGDPAMVAFLCSYFFDGEPVHLNDIYSRADDSTQQYWTLPYVPGKRIVGKDVYILTSKRTFSGAEEFANNMKTLKRATIVGETTGGGAHPTNGHRVTDHFGVSVPFARAINPVTKTNWEGTGVKPDVEVPAELALETAHLAILKKLAKTAGDPDREGQLNGVVAEVEKKLDALKAKAGKGAHPGQP